MTVGAKAGVERSWPEERLQGLEQERSTSGPGVATPPRVSAVGDRVGSHEQDHRERHRDSNDDHERGAASQHGDQGGDTEQPPGAHTESGEPSSPGVGAVGQADQLAVIERNHSSSVRAQKST